MTHFYAGKVITIFKERQVWLNAHLRVSFFRHAFTFSDHLTCVKQVGFPGWLPSSKTIGSLKTWKFLIAC